MRRALISTVYNESSSIARWVTALARQTVLPDEFVIVDGGSTDDTVLRLRDGFARTSFTQPLILSERCNIAEGRNLAIRHTTAELVAATDAGALPDNDWLAEITRPFAEHPAVDVAGGSCPLLSESAFQRRMETYLVAEETPEGADCSPSSRNVAFTRASWESVGGYPEWLTLTAEDSLFNTNLHYAGARFYHQPSARVAWEIRPDFRSYLKMLWSYGYGSAEAGQAACLYRGWLLTTFVPPLILFSPRPLSDAGLRYRRNAAAALGWLAGKWKGHRPPPGWEYRPDGWLSPETLATLQKRSSAAHSLG